MCAAQAPFQAAWAANWCLWSFIRLWGRGDSRHSERASDLPRRWNWLMRRLCLVWANAGSTIALRPNVMRTSRFGREAKLAARRAESCADGGLAAKRPAAGKLIAELLRGGDDEVTEWDHRGAAELHGAVSRGAQQPDRLNDPVGLLWDRLGFAAQEQAGGHLRVDRVALVDTAAVCACGWLTSTT